MYARITGTGSYLPEQVRSNFDLESMVETNNDWIIERTGIEERRIAAPNETVATMGYEASKKALEAAGIDASELDMIILGTTSADKSFPSAACEVQHMLGVESIPAFDLAAACSGFIFSLSVAEQYIKSGMAKKILVIGSDVLSRLCAPDDRTTIILFGDGAGAAVVEASEEEGIISSHLHSDGKFGEMLWSALPDRESPNESYAYMHMSGNDVFKVAVTKLSEIVTKTLAANGITDQDIDWLVPHQANLRIIKATAKKLKMPMEQVVVTLDKHGNTSAASVPLALDAAIRDGRIQKGQSVLLEAFGAGFTWGSVLLKL